MTVGELLRRSLWAMAHPVRALDAIALDGRLPYARLVPVLSIVGMLWGIGHYRLASHDWLIGLPGRASLYALLTYALCSPVAWAMTGAGLFVLARIAHRPRTLAWCDAAACHVWMMWIVSLVFDAVHLSPHVPMRLVGGWWSGGVSFAMHAGWFFLFPMLLVQLVACWRVITGRPVGFAGLAAAFACLGLMRFVLRPLPEFLVMWLSRSHGIGLDFWLAAFHSAWVVGLATLLARRVLSWQRRTLAKVLAVMVVVAGFGLGGVSSAWAGDACTWNTNAAGNWTDTSKWNTCATGGAHYPGQTDATDTVNILIGASANVTLDTSVTVATLTVGVGYAGKLTFDTGTSRTLTVTGTTATAVNIGSLGTLDLSGNGTLTTSANGGGITNAGTITMGSAGAINVKGNVVNSGTFTKGASSALTFNGATAQNWSDSNGTAQDFGAVTLNKTDAGSPGTNNKITLSSSVKATSVTIDGTSGSADTLDGSSYTLTLTGSGTPFVKNGTFTASTSTVNYLGSSSTTVAAATYNNLGVGTTSDTDSAVTYSLGGNTTANGTVTIGHASSTNTDILSTSGSNYTLTAAAITVTAKGSLTGNASSIILTGSGTPFDMGGADRFTENSSTVWYTSTSGATLTQTTYSTLIINGTGGTFTLPATLDINAEFYINNGTATAATNSTTLTAASDVAIESGGAFTKGGTFTFDGTTGGSWRDSSSTGPHDFGAVTINKTDTVAPATNNVVNVGSNIKVTSLVIDGTAGSADTLDHSGGNTLTVTGTGTPLTISGTLDEATSSTIEFTGAGTTTVNGRTYGGNLKINGSGGTFSAGGNITVTSTLTVTAGTFSMDTSTINLKGGTNGTALNLNGGTYQTGTNTNTFGDAAGDSVTVSSGTLEIQSDDTTVDIVKTANTWTNSGGTIIYDSATGISSSLLSGLSAYNILTVNSTGSIYTADGDITVNGDVTVTAGTLAMSTRSLTVGGGDLSVSDTFSQSASGTTTLKGTSATGIGGSGTTTLYNLTIGDGSTSSTVTAAGNLTVNGSFSLTSSTGTNTFNASSRTITLAGSGGTPFALNGETFNADTSTFEYTGNNAGGNTTVVGTSYYNLTVNNSSETFAAGAGVTTNNVLTVTAGTLDMGANNLTVGSTSVTNSGSVKVGSSGAFTQDAGNITTLQSSASGSNCIGATGASCSGTPGSLTFGTLVVGDGSTTTTTTLGGTTPSMTVSGSGGLQIAANATFDAGTSSTVTFSGAGFGIIRSSGATFTAGTSTVKFTSGSGILAMFQTSAMTGSNKLNHLTIEGTGTFFCTAVDIETGGDLTVTSGTMTTTTNNTIGGGDLSVTGTYNQTSGTTTIVTTGSIGGSGTTTFYNLDIGNSSSTQTTTAGGNFTVSGVLTIVSSSGTNTLDASSRTITLSGSGTPFVVNGTFTPSTSQISYTSGSGANVTATTYAGLSINGSGTFVLGTGTGQTLTMGPTANGTGYFILTSGTVDADTYDPNFSIVGTGTLGIAFVLSSGTTWTKGSGTLTFGSSIVQLVQDATAGVQDLGTVVVDNSSASGVVTASALKATSVTINGSRKLDISGDTLTLTGSGTPLTITGTLTEDTSSTVEFAGTGTTTVNARTYGGSLKINGSGGTFNAGGNLIVTSNLTVSAGTLALATNSLTVGTGAGNGHIVGAGSISQSASATTTLKGDGNLGGTSSAAAGTCSGTSGTYTFYNLTLGDGSSTKTTSACGSFTVSSILTVAASHTLDGKSSAITLSGAGTGSSRPFIVNGTFTPTASTVNYTGGSATEVYASSDSGTPSYFVLNFNGTGPFRLGSADGQYLNIGVGGVGTFFVTSGTVDASTYTTTVNLNGSALGVGLLLSSGTTWTKGSGTVTFGGTITEAWVDNTATGQDLGTVVIDNSAAAGIAAVGRPTAATVTINGSRIFNISGDTLVLTGTGTPLTITGTLTENTSSMVEFAATSGTTTVPSRTYGGALKINGSGGTFTTGGSVTATGTLTTQAGTFEVGTSHTVTAANVTISGGTLSMPNSGGILKVSGSGALSMSSGTFSASDVATAPQLTTSDTATPTYVGVSLTGGTLNVSELSVDYLKSTGFVVGSGVTVTGFNAVTWGSNEQTSGSTDVILDITGQTLTLQNHAFPGSSSRECNVRSNTSGIVDMWDWSGGFGGEENDCDESGGEVVWKGAAGSSGGSATHQYPAIY